MLPKSQINRALNPLGAGRNEKSCWVPEVHHYFEDVDLGVWIVAGISMVS